MINLFNYSVHTACFFYSCLSARVATSLPPFGVDDKNIWRVFYKCTNLYWKSDRVYNLWNVCIKKIMVNSCRHITSPFRCQRQKYRKDEPDWEYLKGFIEMYKIVSKIWLFLRFIKCLSRKNHSKLLSPHHSPLSVLTTKLIKGDWNFIKMIKIILESERFYKLQNSKRIYYFVLSRVATKLPRRQKYLKVFSRNV